MFKMKYELGTTIYFTIDNFNILTGKIISSINSLTSYNSKNIRYCINSSNNFYEKNESEIFATLSEISTYIIQKLNEENEKNLKRINELKLNI